jgi:hypothetical protein
MCCCVADATTTEHKFLKRHNEKFEMIVNIGGSSLRVAGNHSARFSLALHVDDCAFVPPSYEIQKKTGDLVVKNRLISGDGTTSRWKFFFVAWKARRSKARARNQIRINAFNHFWPSVREVLNPPQRYGDEFLDRSTFGPPEDARLYVNPITILFSRPIVRALRQRPRYCPPS